MDGTQNRSAMHNKYNTRIVLHNSYALRNSTHKFYYNNVIIIIIGYVITIDVHILAMYYYMAFSAKTN